MVDLFPVGEDAMKAAEFLAAALAEAGVVDDEADGAAASGGNSGGHFFVAAKDFHEGAVDAAGIGAAFGLFTFKAVEFGKDIGGDAEVVVFEAIEAAGLVEEDVGVEDVVFSFAGGRFEAEAFKSVGGEEGVEGIWSNAFEGGSFGGGFDHFFREGGEEMLRTVFL